MTKPVLAALDLADVAHHAAILDKAARMAALEGAPLAVMTVLPDFGMSQVGTFFPAGAGDKALAAASTQLHEITARLLPDSQVRHLVMQGGIYHEILEAAKGMGARLIVMGAHRPALSD